MSSLYAALLGAAWESLAPAVRRLHQGGTRARALFSVRRGTGLLARFAAAIARMPPQAEEVDVTLAVELDGESERWCRDFGGVAVRTAQWGRRGLLVEAFGLMQCIFRLRAEAGALIFDQVAAALGFRSVALPLPRFLAPHVEGRVDAEEGGVHVDVRIYAPIVGLVVAYEGRVIGMENPAPPR
jgi:hypothetical protein